MSNRTIVKPQHKRVLNLRHKYVDPTWARCTCGDRPVVAADKPVCPRHAPKAYVNYEAKHAALLCGYMYGECSYHGDACPDNDNRRCDNRVDEGEFCPEHTFDVGGLS